MAVNVISRIKLQWGNSQKSDSAVSDLLTLFLNNENFKCTICVLCVRQCIQVFFDTYIEIVLNRVSQYQYEKCNIFSKSYS